jgi:small conductance mechanosensitive channel
MKSRMLFVCALLLCGVMTALLPRSSVAQDQATDSAAQEGPSTPGNDASASAEGKADESLPAKVFQPDIDIEELDFRLVPLTKDELKQLAEKWLRIVKSKTEEVMETQLTLAKTADGADGAVRESLTELHTERNQLFDKYSAVLDAWEKKGGDVAAIADYRAYRSSIIVEETRKADFKTLVARAIAWLTSKDGGIQLAKGFGIIVASFLGLLIVAGLVRRFVRRWIGHVPNISNLLQAFIIGVVYWIVLAFGLMAVLSALGVDITPLFALVGGASIILAFAMQDTLSNLASGLMIMIYRPFDEGDFVDVGGVAGTVKTTNIVATTVTTPDNQVIVIPNKNVWGNIITNVTASDTRRVDLVFGISYDDSIPEAVHVLEEVVAAHPLVLKEPEPTIRVNELADSSVNLICRPWVKTEDYWAVYWDLTRYVKEHFDEAGISIPYPQQDVHFMDSAPTPRSTKRSRPGIEKQPASGSVSSSAGDEGQRE